MFYNSSNCESGAEDNKIKLPYSTPTPEKEIVSVKIRFGTIVYTRQQTEVIAKIPRKLRSKIDNSAEARQFITMPLKFELNLNLVFIHQSLAVYPEITF